MRPGDRLFLLGLLAAVTVCYASGLGAPFAFDDVGLLNNPNLGSLSALWRGFLNPHPLAPVGVQLPSYAYRPLTEASFMANGWVAGWGLPGLRVGNLAVHFGAAVLVFVLARRVGAACGVGGRVGLGGAGFARWAAIFFAVHPLGVQAVTYVYQRAVSLEALLLYGTLALYWKGRERPWGWAYWGALGMGLLAMGAKESAVTLPLLLGVLEWVLRRPGEALAAALKRWLSFALLPLVVAVQIWRIQSHPDGTGPEGLRESGIQPVGFGFTRLQYFCLQLPIVLRYLSLGLLPFPLHFGYDRTPPLPGTPFSLPVGATALSALLLAGLIAFVAVGPQRFRLPRLSLALFLAPLALESSVFPIKDLAANHRCYPGLLGAALGFAWAMTRLRRPLALGAGVLALLAAMTLAENRVWSDPSGLLRREVRHAFHVTTTWADYGWDRLEAGRAGEAMPFFRRARRSPWYDTRVASGSVAALWALGRPAEAHEEIARGLGMMPEHPTLLWLAVQQSQREGDAAALERLARRAKRLPALTPPLARWLASREDKCYRP